jgi:RND superfamily putative drug exporter
MSGMYLSGMLLFDGFATAAVLVVLVAVIGSVTVLPALLSVLGDRVELGRVPGLARMRRPGEGSKVWGIILDRVLERPGLSVVASVAFLVLLALPAITIHTEKLSLDKLLPADTSIMLTYRHITQALPGGAGPGGRGRPGA